MVENSIEDIRKNAVAEIKEKVKKNPKFLSPVNKERLEYQEKLKFANGNEFTCWMQQNGILNSAVRARDKYYQDKGFKNRQDYEDCEAKRLGFENEADRYRPYKREWQKEKMWNKGREPSEFNDECTLYLGVHIGEKLYRKFLLTIFEQVKWNGGYRDGGIDFVCKNPKKEFIDKYPHLKLTTDKEYRIQLRLRCINYQRCSKPRWNFAVTINSGKPDYFIFSAWDNSDSLTPLHIWMIHKDEMIWKGKGYTNKRPLWDRAGLSVHDNPCSISKFKKYELEDELKILKKLYDDMEK